jgi:hypothetical protein
LKKAISFFYSITAAFIAAGLGIRRGADDFCDVPDFFGGVGSVDPPL